MTVFERIPARILDGAIAAVITAGMLVDTVLGAHDGPWWGNLLCSLVPPPPVLPGT